MKTYEVPHRGPQCPTGRHAANDPVDDRGEPIYEDEAARLRVFNEVCDCPWLTVASTTPEPHTTSWTRRELENLIKEMDAGHFDPKHFPPRNNASRFMPPDRQYLLQLLDGDDKLGAVQHLLTSIKFDRIVWDPVSTCLSLRRQVYGRDGRIVQEWLQLHFDAQAGHQYTARGETPGGNPDTIDGLWEEAPAQVTAEQAQTRALIDGSRLQITGLVSNALELDNPAGQGWVDEPLQFPNGAAIDNELGSDDDGS